MSTHRARAAFVGVAFLIAMVTSIAGGVVLEPALAEGGARLAAGGASTVALGVTLEMVNVIAVIAIAVGLYPLFRVAWLDVALGYVALRILEAAFLALAALIPLVASSVARTGSPGSGGDGSATLGTLAYLLALRSEILGVMIPMLFAAGAVLLYAWMYRAVIVPRLLSVWGLIGVAGIVLANILNAGGAITMALALPIISNEIVLGAWLIARGVRTRQASNLTNEMEFAPG